MSNKESIKSLKKNFPEHFKPKNDKGHQLEVFKTDLTKIVSNPSPLSIQVNGSHYQKQNNPLPVIILTGKYISFCAANAFKYIIRFNLKGNPEEDLKKAIHYLSIMINNEIREVNISLDDNEVYELLFKFSTLGIDGKKLAVIANILGMIYNNYHENHNKDFLQSCKELLVDLYSDYLNNK